MNNAECANPPGCPQCQTPLIRVTRTATDRLISLWRPVWRCRCPSMDCGWEGRLRSSGPNGVAGAWGHSYRGRGPVLDVSRSGWVSGGSEGRG